MTGFWKNKQNKTQEWVSDQNEKPEEQEEMNQGCTRQNLCLLGYTFIPRLCNSFISAFTCC